MSKTIEKHIQKTNHAKTTCTADSIAFLFFGEKMERRMNPRWVIDNVDSSVDAERKTFGYFAPVDHHGEYMIQSGNFVSYWIEELQLDVMDALQDMNGRWDIDHDRVAPHLSSAGPPEDQITDFGREKVYYMPDIPTNDLEEMLWYQWTIPVKHSDPEKTP